MAPRDGAPRPPTHGSDMSAIEPPQSTDEPPAFEQSAFAASAAALVANHTMSDRVWDLYFPEIPKSQPELRTILIETHQKALSGQPNNIGETVRFIEDRFDVSDNTAREWIRDLVELKFLVHVPAEKKNEFHVVPSTPAKTGLFKVGQEYALFLGLLGRLLRSAEQTSDLDVEQIDWFRSVETTLTREAVDYPTSC
jgi:hypothetical protein